MTLNRSQQKFAERLAAGMSVEDARSGICSNSTAYDWKKIPELQQRVEELRLIHAEQPASDEAMEADDADGVDLVASLRRALARAEQRGDIRGVVMAADALSKHHQRVAPKTFELSAATEAELVEIVGHVTDWGTRGRIMEITSRWFGELFPDHEQWTWGQIQRWDETGEVPSTKRAVTLKLAQQAAEAAEQEEP